MESATDEGGRPTCGAGRSSVAAAVGQDLPSRPSLSRRQFIARGLAVSCTARVWGACAGRAAEWVIPSIVVFSKVYQELKLNYDQAAAVTAEAGLNGVDCPVRPDGEITPERATEEMSRYVAALAKRGLQMPLITTAITSVASPHTEDILRTARKLSVQYLPGWLHPASTGRPGGTAVPGSQSAA